MALPPKTELRASGCCEGNLPWRTRLPAVLGEGQLLLCGVPGDGRTGMDGCSGRLSGRATTTPGTRLPSFLRQLREKRSGPIRVIRDNAPAHRGDAVWEYLRTLGLGLRLVSLPGYSPNFNADEAIWLGEGRSDRKPVLGDQGPGAGECDRISRQPVGQEG